MSKLFRIEPHTTTDKKFHIFNDEITVIVDFDDVNHAEVDRAARKMAKILNEHWEPNT